MLCWEKANEKSKETIESEYFFFFGGQGETQISSGLFAPEFIGQLLWFSHLKNNSLLHWLEELHKQAKLTKLVQVLTGRRASHSQDEAVVDFWRQNGEAEYSESCFEVYSQ